MAIFKIRAEKCECQKNIATFFFAVNLVRLFGDLAICDGSCGNQREQLSNADKMLDSARDLGPEFIATQRAEKCECQKNIATQRAEKCECGDF